MEQPVQLDHNLRDLNLSPCSETSSERAVSPTCDLGMESSVSIGGSLDSPSDDKSTRLSFLRVDGNFREKVAKCSLPPEGKARVLRTLEVVDLASKAINCGMEIGALPTLAVDDASTSGSYFVRGADRAPIGVFKPVDEEPYAKNNPKGNISVVGSGPGIKSGINIGEGAVREVIAYILDHGSFAGVPPTAMALSKNEAYCYNSEFAEMGIDVHMQSPGGSDESASKVKKYLPKLPPKVGSVQMFVPHTADAENLGNSYWEVEEVQRIAMLDIRLCNTDRNAANMLVRAFNDISMEGKAGNAGSTPSSDGSKLWTACLASWKARMQLLAQRSLQQCHSDETEERNGDHCIVEEEDETRTSDTESETYEEGSTEDVEEPITHDRFAEDSPVFRGMTEPHGSNDMEGLPARSRSNSCFMPSPAYSVASQPLPERSFDTEGMAYFPKQAGLSKDIMQFMSPDFGPASTPTQTLDGDASFVLNSEPNQASVWRSGAIRISSFGDRSKRTETAVQQDAKEHDHQSPLSLRTPAQTLADADGNARGGRDDLHTPPPKATRSHVGVFLSKFAPVSPVPAPHSPSQGRDGAASTTGIARSVSETGSEYDRQLSTGGKSCVSEEGRNETPLMDLSPGNEAWADVEDEELECAAPILPADAFSSGFSPTRTTLQLSPGRSTHAAVQGEVSASLDTMPMTILATATSASSSLSPPRTAITGSPAFARQREQSSDRLSPQHSPENGEVHDSPHLSPPTYVSPTSPPSPDDQGTPAKIRAPKPPRRVSARGRVLLAALGIANDSVTPVSLPGAGIPASATPERPAPLYQRNRSRSVSNTQHEYTHSRPVPDRGAGPTLVATLRSMGVDNKVSPKDRGLALIANVAASAAVRNRRHRAFRRPALGKPPLNNKPFATASPSPSFGASSSSSPPLGPLTTFDAAGAGVMCSSTFVQQCNGRDSASLVLQCRDDGFGLPGKAVAPALKAATSHELVPIDHGLILPHIGVLDDVFFAWRTWKQVKQPIVPSVRAYIESLDGRADALVLWELFGTAIRPGSLLTLRVCTCLLQEGAKAGLTFHQMALLMERTYEPSPLEIAIRDTRTALSQPGSDESSFPADTPSGRFFADHDRFMDLFPRFMRAHIRRQLSQSN